MIITITMRVNRDGVKDLFDYESDRRRLICMNCLRKSYVFQLPQNQWNAFSAHVNFSCSHTVLCSHGNKLATK